MSKTVPKKSAIVRGATGERLLAAASAEFREHGFAGTDSNKIARAAGFAPQTFYRWFRDKTEIFVAVYRSWEERERGIVDALLARGASARRVADAIVAFHREHLVFRRSLRQLAVQDEVVREARAASRLRQIERIRAWAGSGAPKPSLIALSLLQIERLADAIAEGELRDMGMDEVDARAALTRLIAQLSERHLGR